MSHYVAIRKDICANTGTAWGKAQSGDRMTAVAGRKIITITEITLPASCLWGSVFITQGI